uniref:Sugar phosphate transporter domain-containing protein n=2 Tax=Pseudo-nitzschia australis TaxID=44445 RepID=A0A7S4EED6_9STRA|mmetsp:Transcript_2210/g.4721  ORF Transcript_2210/g.4721 Transcript_2210/m.4721 type:complete len:392 (+) Transcript_2210:93-1268(+)|eukprot:CAMPEP_0168169996 /NCGR_PEP_ID=MMETSP0139_2-20121125/3934_1 /TAXON_ID=44445 /ORGANISM="Pseudo-nitzschia australis, Strain 10249 10 AB" /LENGTH=391 /DNA_ID=CAMNT_0008087449 /DNA_START=22 /DNA_END=1197 /DNA_ORIENTATION=-
MKVTALALLTIFATSSSAFGLNGGAKTLAQSATRSVGAFKKSALVQPVDIQGNRLSNVALSDASAAISVRGGAADAAPAEKSGPDLGLIAYFALWYLGNYYYNITNKLALNAAGGKVGFPMTLSSLQLGVGAIYGLFLWLAPDARAKPTVTMEDLIKMLPVAFCFMGAHSASVFAMGMGAVSFAQIVKASEPAFSAVLSQYVYGKPISKAKWLCLPIVIGGVILASVKELDFAWSALISACIANMFAAVKGNENKKLMETPGLRDRLGSVGNQFALTTILGFILSLPVVAIQEGSRFGEFCELAKTTPAIWKNLLASGLWFYGYNECATLTLKKTGAVTQSVANTAKRVIVIVGVALVLGESLDPIKMLGCSIGIGGVLLYSIIDQLVAKK